MQPLNVLISLHKGYGLGDAVQVSAVLRHVVAARPNWSIDFQAEEGRHCVGRGIVANTFAYGAPYSRERYDAEVQVHLYDTWANFHDRPNTRVSSCLHERFGLPWLPEHGRYRVDVSPEATDQAAAVLHDEGRRTVAVHYAGDSSPLKKNLSHDQADRICRRVEMLGYVPVVLDWRDRSRLPCRRLRYPAAWGGDAEMVCAVIRQCRAFVGIDSGPSKCASATDTPALVVWTGHHPAPFHDPASNTTHLVPRGYHGLEPVCDDLGVIEWFEANHTVREYRDDLVTEVGQWLTEVLQ